MSEHIVRVFGEALDGLSDSVNRMGEATVRQIAQALDAYQRHDRELAQAVVRADKTLNAMEAGIEHDAVRLIALRQPVASDLRQTLAAIKIASNLERCGDLARGIAWRSQAVEAVDKHPQLGAEVEAMWRLVRDRLAEVMKAYAQGDVELALKVWREDDLVDDHFASLFAGLVDWMTASQNSIADCAHLLFVAKNLERIGDHSTNIAELVVYQATGDTIGEDGQPTSAGAAG